MIVPDPRATGKSGLLVSEMATVTIGPMNARGSKSRLEGAASTLVQFKGLGDVLRTTTLTEFFNTFGSKCWIITTTVYADRHTRVTSHITKRF